MGWNTSALFLHGATAQDAVDSVAAESPTGERAGPDEATTGLAPESLYAAESHGWAQVWNPMVILEWEPDDAVTALTAYFSSVASTYGFTLYESGEIRRRYVFSEGEVVVDEGEPLPVESTIEVPSWGPDEDFVWAVITAVTGVTYDENLVYQAWALAV